MKLLHLGKGLQDAQGVHLHPMQEGLRGWLNKHSATPAPWLKSLHLREWFCEMPRATPAANAGVQGFVRLHPNQACTRRSVAVLCQLGDYDMPSSVVNSNVTQHSYSRVMPGGCTCCTRPRELADWRQCMSHGARPSRQLDLHLLIGQQPVAAMPFANGPSKPPGSH